MSQNIIRSMVTAVEILILIYVIICSIRLIKAEKYPVSVIFFMIGVMSVMMSLMYWLVFEYMMPPDVRMPFAANEIGESAGFLLFATSLKAAFAEFTREKFRFHLRETVAAVVFTAANIFLWIEWSGEFVQDLVGGAAIGYLLIILANTYKNVACSPQKWAILYALAWVTVLLEVIRLFASPTWYIAIDSAANVIRLATIGYCLYAAVRSVRGPDRGIHSYAIVAYCFIWCTFAMYMSVEPIYFVPNFISVLSVQMMMLSLRKAVNEA